MFDKTRNVKLLNHKDKCYPSRITCVACATSRETAIMDRWSIAQGAVVEAMRPKTSGHAIDAHVVMTQVEIRPDYEKMRRQIFGDTDLKDTTKAS